MSTSKSILGVIALLFTLSVVSQEIQLTKKDSIVKSFWLVSLGTNIVDDSGDEFGKLLDLQDGWNMVPYPSRISVGHYFESGLGLEAIATYNTYKEGKIIDNVVNMEDVDYIGMDFRISYDLNMILGETGFFDPYVGIGAGYTDANNQGRGTYNAIVGFRTWFSDHWGLDFNTTGKWTMNTENSTNHIQHALGVAYRFRVKKGLSRKGEEKKAMLEELEKEQQRIQDSIAAQQLAEEEARQLAERLRKEKEAAELAAAEKAKEEADQAHRNKIKNEIENLGTVYFSLNSSYLTNTDKDLLNQLVKILKENPNMVVRVAGHTDARGSDTYNQWLSVRRAERTVAYVKSAGISEERILFGGFGEEQLTNECEDGVPCPESKHSKNRRSEFIIEQF